MSEDNCMTKKKCGGEMNVRALPMKEPIEQMSEGRRLTSEQTESVCTISSKPVDTSYKCSCPKIT